MKMSETAWRKMFVKSVFSEQGQDILCCMMSIVYGFRG